MILQNLLITFFCLLGLAFVALVLMKVQDIVRWKDGWVEHLVAGIMLLCLLVCAWVVWWLLNNPVAS